MLGELTTQEVKHTHTLNKSFFQAINFFKDHDNYFAGSVLCSAPTIFSVLKRGEKCVEELHSPPPLLPIDLLLLLVYLLMGYKWFNDKSLQKSTCCSNLSRKYKSTDL